MALQPEAEQQAWRVLERLLHLEGEVRASLVRMALVFVFYVIQLVNFVSLADRTPEAIQHHRIATWLAVAAVCLSMMSLVVITKRWFPPFLKYSLTAGDLALITILCGVGSGPASPAVNLFYLVIAMAGLRQSLPLVWFTTLAAMGCYEWLVGLVDKSWFDADHTTPLIEQLMRHATLAGVGMVVGQNVRMLRASVMNFGNRAERVMQQHKEAA